MARLTVPSVSTPRTIPSQRGDRRTPRSSVTRQPTFRRDIGALRAIAVMLVVVAHIWPHGVLHGGYIGVDVFFVISGFLITAGLSKELTRTGRIGVLSFFARRIRRLAPAALVVLAVTAIAVFALFDGAARTHNIYGVVASALQVQNLWLASESTSYWNVPGLSLATQHYWSLAVEEQFYLVWPFVLIGVWRAVAPLGRAHSRKLDVLADRHRLLIIALSTICAASFICSLVWTPAAPDVAFYMPFTRAWEFAAGALLAVTGFSATTARTATLLRHGGVAAIILAAIALPHSAHVPGHLALWPVLGTVAVIAAGHQAGDDTASRIFNTAPIQWLGHASYSLYLWHWPVIVFAAVLWPSLTTWWFGIILAAASLGLAAVTSATVEHILRPQENVQRLVKPVRTLTTSTGALIAGGLASLTLVATTLATEALTTRGNLTAAARALVAIPEECRGAAALAPGTTCEDPYNHKAVAVLSTGDGPWLAGDPTCKDVFRKGNRAAILTCGEQKQPSAHIVVIGDSHAEQYSPALAQLAEQRRWKVTYALRGGCPPTLGNVTSRELDYGPTACADWMRDALPILASMKPDVILASSYGASVDYPSEQARIDGFHDFADNLPQNIGIVLVRDNPFVAPGTPHVTQCLTKGHDDCTWPADDKALPADPLVDALTDNDKVIVADYTPTMCPDGTCQPIVGGVRVHWDDHHISRQWAMSLAPQLAAVIDEGLSLKELANA